MRKELHGVYFNGLTFGMYIETKTEQYERFKESIQSEDCINAFGEKMRYKVLTVPYMKLAPIMREAHWLVSERKCFNKISIPGLRKGEEIFVKYDDEPMDFRNRRSIDHWGEIRTRTTE